MPPAVTPPPPPDKTDELIAALEGLTAIQNEESDQRRGYSKKSIRGRADEILAQSKTVKAANALNAGIDKLAAVTLKGLKMISGPFVSSFKDGFAQFEKIEKFGAQFNRSIGQNWVATRELADSLGGPAGIASDLDSFKFGLEVQNIGLNKNSAGLQKMWRATQRSGEDFGKLTGGIRSATAGFGTGTISVNNLVNTQETLVNSLDMTRTQLVEAMNALSEDTKDMANSLGIKGLQETQMQMKGFLKDEQLFNSFSKNFQEMLGAGGLVKSVQLGVEGARGSVLEGGANLKNVFGMIFKGAARSREMLAGVEGQTSPEVRAALSEAGVIADKNMRLEQAIRENAIALLSETRTEKEVMAMTGDQLATEVSAKMAATQAMNQEFSESISTLKKAILMPMINAGAQVAQSIKNFLSKNKTDLGGIVTKISLVVLKVANALLKFASFIKDKVMPHFDKVVVALAAIAAGKAGQSIGKWIGGAVGAVGGFLVGGPVGAVVGAKAGYAIGGAVGGTAGAVMGGKKASEMMDSMSGGTKGPLDDMIAQLETDTMKADAIRDNTDATAQAAKAQVEILEENKDKGDLRQLVDSLDGFSRFQVRQSSLIEENLVTLNGQIGKVEENTAIGAETGLESLLQGEESKTVIGPALITGFTPVGG